MDSSESFLRMAVCKFGVWDTSRKWTKWLVSSNRKIHSLWERVFWETIKPISEFMFLYDFAKTFRATYLVINDFVLII